VVISLLVWAGKGLLNRVGNDVLNTAYSGAKNRGHDLLDGLLGALGSGDEAAAEKAALTYANHLRENPRENDVVLAATVNAFGTEPVELYDAVVRVMCNTVANLKTLPRGPEAGCAAFVGSFPNPEFVTVLDVRNYDFTMRDPLGLDNYSGQVGVHFGYSVTDFPRMWIIEVPEGRTPEELAATLNAHLLNKHENRDAFNPLRLDERLRTELGASRMWLIFDIFDDRVEIYYPGQFDRVTSASEEEFDPSAPPSELEVRRKAEAPLFDIADTRGPEALLASVAELRSSADKSEAAFQAGLARLVEELRKAMARDAS